MYATCRPNMQIWELQLGAEAAVSLAPKRIQATIKIMLLELDDA